ncbi:DUF92 domain-containing protein [Peribacillus cavernae]|uniref:DUF92 domain-containing protein n=1 Tax=Peribacillus cavernae TaxID=1674310 RepID=A0A433HJ72_9BACI|nr:DUF92 domain-containing protein [Peribacillus cavernae]MDQ0218311.1 uncharacterized protein (TIGR00297 family) [Peribacillus cavernae]RUQ28407.1 DUF92 domain-containing protein [Peribacillus cavernae]
MLGNYLYLGFILITAIVGYLVKSLSKSGAAATVLVGVSVLLGFELAGLLLLGVFFASSSFWSKFKASKKKHVEEKLQKGDARDWQQVLANGGIAAIASCIHFFTPSELSLFVFIVSIAAANSDTWASEIGVLSKQRPFYILHLRSVERGTSGAVSLLGSTAAVLGAGLIAVFAVVLFGLPWHPWLLLAVLFGFLGNLFDTLLGALIQARFRCRKCGLETEKTVHCGESTGLIKGCRWFNNDVINASAIALASICALLSFKMFNS